MKKKIAQQITLLVMMSAILLVSSCGICTHCPLAAENETHEELLEGVWKSHPIADNSDIYTIRNHGKYYSAEHNKNNTPLKLTLTKLNNRYFISNIEKNFSLIWMIHVDERNLILYTMSEKTINKYKNAFKDGVLQLPTSELRKFCASHANDFSVVVKKFTRISTSKKKHTTTPASSKQKLYTDFINELFSCRPALPEAAPSQSELIELGHKFQSAADKMYRVISRYNLPETIQNAAINYARSISDAGRTFRAAPYIPVDELDAFMNGFFRGLTGDITGGTAEISQWQNAIKVKIEAIINQEDNLKIIMIKHGVTF